MSSGRMDLAGKAALVTGGGTGCGRAIALALAEAGCDVAIGYSRSRDEAEATAAEIRALGRRAAAVQGDVSRQVEAHRVVAEAAAAVGDGGLDVLVNNAGMTRGVPLERIQEITEDDWRGIMDLNAGAHLWTTQAAAPLMAARGGGSILNVTSNSAVTYLSSSLVYVASKVAANALTRMLARAVPEGVRVNAIAPGWMDTRWIDAYVLPELRDRVRSGDLPVTSLASVASMAVEIIRNEGMVGETVVIDAGELARG
jgi:3-oxoacyl-[acyl-carrier protein] reductase